MGTVTVHGGRTGKVSLMELLLTATSASVIGFLAGLLSIRKAERFCPRCGVTNTCPIGHGNDAHARYDNRPGARP